MTLGEFLAGLRERAGYSHSKVGLVLEVSRQMVFQWESGRRRVTPYRAKQLLRLYDATAEETAEAMRLGAADSGWNAT